MKKIIISLSLAAVLFAGCGGTNSETVEVNLTDEQIAAFEADVAKWDELINTPVVCDEESETSTTSTEEEEMMIIDGETGEEIETEGITYRNVENCDTRPNIDYFVEKARSLENLGRIGEAIQTYDEAFDLYDNSSVGWHNLGRLYEKIGKYQEAAENYQKLIDTFKLKQYHRDVAWALVKAGDADGAEKAYILFTTDFGGEDNDLKQAIEELQ